MTGLFASVLLAGSLLLAAYLYLRVEPPVAGRWVLFGLRIGALLLLVALILDPALPGSDPATGPRELPTHWILVDPDPALGVRTDSGTLWDELIEEIRAHETPGTAIVRLGSGGVEGTTLEALEASGPAERSVEPGDALLHLAELGADSLTFLSPLRIRPAPFNDVLSRLPLPLRPVRIGGRGIRNAAVADLRLPAGAPPDEPISAEIVLMGEGGEPGDSVRVTVQVRGFDEALEAAAGEEPTGSGPSVSGSDPTDGPLIYDALHSLPAIGTRGTIEIELPAPGTEGLRRYRAAVELDGDRFRADDERIRVVRVGRIDGGIILISLRPDWEPRTLLPVLEQATGIDGEGFLRVGEDRYLTLGSGLDAGRPVESDDLLEQARSAALLVLHGATESIPTEVRDLVETHPRVVHLPADPTGVSLAGLQSRPGVGGEWVVPSPPPSSPLTPWLTGLDWSTLPPLSGVLVLDEPSSVEVGLELRPPGGGPAVPALVLVTTPSGRAVVALAREFWRWGTRSGEPRQAYRNLWAGTADWLLARDGPADSLAIRPESFVLPRGGTLPWVAPGYEDREVTIEVRPLSDVESAGPVLRRERLKVGTDGRFEMAALPPGAYRYQSAAGPAADQERDDVSERVPDAGGVFEVEAFQDALLRLPLDPGDLVAGEGAPAGAVERAARRPLHSHPLPWILLIGLLSLEWIGRRRIGLR